MVPVGKSRFALVSPEDEHLVRDLRWYASERRTGCCYAIRDRVPLRCEETGAVNIGTLYMHRLIIGASRGQVVDHINGDGLDNRRENLRLASRSQNAAHSPRRARPASGFRGVYYAGPHRWKVVVTYNRADIRGGTFDCKLEAARKYDEMAREFFGEFAVLNFPERQSA